MAYVDVYVLELTAEDWQMFPDFIKQQAQEIISNLQSRADDADKPFSLLTYLTPEAGTPLSIGDIVEVPYGKRRRIGVYLGQTHDKIDLAIHYRPIIRRLNEIGRQSRDFSHGKDSPSIL